jgi:hypothetical protein
MASRFPPHIFRLSCGDLDADARRRAAGGVNLEEADEPAAVLRVDLGRFRMAALYFLFQPAPEVSGRSSLSSPFFIPALSLARQVQFLKHHLVAGLRDPDDATALTGSPGSAAVRAHAETSTFLGAVQGHSLFIGRAGGDPAIRAEEVRRAQEG